MPKLEADDTVQIDLRGYQCPLPVLKTRNAMRKLVDGDQIVVLTDDALAVIDIPNFCQEYGQDLISQQPIEKDGHRFVLCRRGEKL